MKSKKSTRVVVGYVVRSGIVPRHGAYVHPSKALAPEWGERRFAMQWGYDEHSKVVMWAAPIIATQAGRIVPVVRRKCAECESSKGVFVEICRLVDSGVHPIQEHVRMVVSERDQLRKDLALARQELQTLRTTDVSLWINKYNDVLTERNGLQVELNGARSQVTWLKDGGRIKELEGLLAAAQKDADELSRVGEALADDDLPGSIGRSRTPHAQHVAAILDLVKRMKKQIAKPHGETWRRCGAGGCLCPLIWREENGPALVVRESHDGDVETRVPEEVMSLIKCAPEMARMLRRLSTTIEFACPVCSNVLGHHDRTCELAVLLIKAGVLDEAVTNHALECDHCGDDAIRKPTGVFVDGEGDRCESCGFPGHVSVDGTDDDPDENTPSWKLSEAPDARCTDPECGECCDDCKSATGGRCARHEGPEAPQW
jgi:hypothetical protein